MEQERMNTYEGFFLLPQAAAIDLQAAADHIKSLLARIDAEIISFAKWDERRLAYEIKGNKRGIYFLVYFKSAGEKLAGLERDCNLSEQILRCMITRAELIPDEAIQAADGQSKLADEIKLRSEKAATVGTGETSRIESKAEKEAPAPAPPPGRRGGHHHRDCHCHRHHGGTGEGISPRWRGRQERRDAFGQPS